MELVEKNIDLVLDFSATKIFRIIWAETGNQQLLISESERKLKLFNYFVSKFENQNDQDIDVLKSLINSKNALLMKTERGFASEFEYIKRELLDSGIYLKEVNIKDLEKQNIPKFEINEDKYNKMFQKAVEQYPTTYLYKLLKIERCVESANNGLKTHLNLTGEILTQIFAKDFIKTFTDLNTSDVPENFKITISGEKYLKELNSDKDLKVIDKGFIKNLRNRFLSKRDEQNFKNK